ncbi:tyrosine-type recombinase/integrase [Saccharomonospora glauca]|nr:tyrosine-type recombinase/integrase [Saccharomonospora glauca]
MTALAPTETTIEHVDADHWTERVAAPTMSWLLARRSDHTKTAYATRLGIPREHQTWRGPNTRSSSHKPVPPYAWFRWCLARDLDPLTDVTVDVMRAWVATIREHGGTDATIQAYAGAVSAWYREMRKRSLTDIVMSDVLDTDERRAQGISTVSPSSPTHALTYEQAMALRASARMDPRPTRARNIAIVELLLSTGVRAAELCALTRGSISREGREGVLTVHGKGGKTRTVRLTSTALAAVDAYLLERDQADAGTDVALAGQVSGQSTRNEPLFLSSRTRKPLTPAQIRQLLSRLCGVAARHGTTAAARRAAAELAPICGSIHPHQCRRFYAVHAVSMGVSVEQVRDDLGHASLTTTQRYLADAARLTHSGAYAVSASLEAGNAEWGIAEPLI